MEAKLAPSTPSDRPWSLGRRLGFRLAFAFWFWEIFPFPLDWIRQSEIALKPIMDGWNKLILLNATLLGLTVNVDAPANGSGDTLSSWLRSLVLVELTIVCALVWSLIDRRRRDYRGLHRFLRLWLRYWLAGALFLYGLIKILCLQMPFMLTRAIEPYGQSSPMGLLWTALGQSPGYQIFAGSCEAAAGLLLLFRRTTSLGSLVGAGVMTNVFVLNMTYDVPVKIYSFTLLLGCLFLVAPVLRPLLDLLVLRRPVAARTVPARSRRMVIACAVVEALFAGYLGYQVGKIVSPAWSRYGPFVRRPPVTGIYDVVEMTRDLKPVPLLATDDKAYSRFVIEPDFGGVLCANGRFFPYGGQIDEKAHTITARSRGSKTPGVLFYTRGDGGEVTLAGVFLGQLITLELKRAEMSQELLYTRGFHWVNELPFNR